MDVTFLERLLSIPSPSGQEDAVGEFLVAEMLRLGFSQAYRDEVGNAIGIAGDPQARREIVLLGHMDTVPGEIPVRRQGSLLYGRGAVDAKGPLAAFVLAATRAAPALKNTHIVVIGAVEEESHGRGAQHVARTTRPPAYAIVGEPSDWEGITLGYKGRLCVHYRLIQPGGHSAGELAGPAEKAVAFWNKLMTMAERFNQGQEERFSTLDPALLEFRTFSNGLDDGVEMNITVRIPPGMDVGELQQQMLGWREGATLAFPGSDPAFRSDKNSPVVRALLRAIRAEGGRPRFKLKTGTSDMNTVGPIWGCPIAAYGPGDSSLDHTPHEHIDVHEFRHGVNVLTQALTILGGA